MKTTLKAFLVIALLLIPVTTLASEKNSAKQSISVEVGNDIYSAGNFVELKNPTDDDAYLAGVLVNIDKKVEGDLIVAGSSITIISEVGDDLRVAGSVITLASQIAGDAIIAGGVINITESSAVAGDASIAGGILNFDGSVDGDLQLSGDEIIFGGKVAGDVTIRVGKKIEFGENAKVTGKLTYFSKNEIAIPAGIASEIERGEKAESLGLLKKLFISIISFFAGAILLIFLGRSSETFADTIRQKPWWSLFTGTLVLFIPLLVIFLLVTVVGTWLGVTLLFAWILSLLVNGALMGFLIGSLIIKQKENKYWKKLITLALGSIIIFAIRFLPEFSVIFKFTIFVFSLGALTLSRFQLYKAAKKAKLV